MIKPRQTLSKIEPYIPGKSIAQVKSDLGLHDVIKMASNENPLGCPIAWSELSNLGPSIHHYPHPPSTGIFEALVHFHGLSRPHFLLGNGSDELILFLALAFLNPGDEIVISEHTFSEYAFCAHLMDASVKRVPMREGYQIDAEALIRAISPLTKLIFVANPNNPTGTYLSHQEVERLCQALPEGLVVLDEAYAEFAEAADFPDVKVLLKKYKNIVSLRTFSKLFGLAGFRIGYAMADPNIIAWMDKTSMPFHVSSVAIEAAKLALGKTQFIAQSKQIVHEGKHFLTQELQKRGLEVLPSQANFVAFFVPNSAQEVTQGLLSQGIIVRALTSFGLPTGIRVTIGLSEHNHRFLQALDLVLKGD